MAVNVGGHLNRAVDHLFLHIHQRLALLKQQAREGVPQDVDDSGPPPTEEDVRRLFFLMSD